VLSPSDRRHLSRLYLERVRPTGSPLIYYHLLTHLARHKDARAWAILERVRRVVRRRFGASFVVVNDFFSYRARGVALFQGWHQDGEFWLTADGSSAACSGLNLWILLDHRGMNRSFDVLDSTTARPLYSTLYAAARRGSNLRRVNRSAAAGIAAAAAAGDGVLNSVESLFGSSAPETNKRLLRPAVFERLSRVSGTGRRPWVNVPLEPGDALVLRQARRTLSSRSDPLQPLQPLQRTPRASPHRAPLPSAHAVGAHLAWRQHLLPQATAASRERSRDSNSDLPISPRISPDLAAATQTRPCSASIRAHPPRCCSLCTSSDSRRYALLASVPESRLYLGHVSPCPRGRWSCTGQTSRSPHRATGGWQSASR